MPICFVTAAPRRAAARFASLPFILHPAASSEPPPPASILLRRHSAERHSPPDCAEAIFRLQFFSPARRAAPRHAVFDVIFFMFLFIFPMPFSILPPALPIAAEIIYILYFSFFEACFEDAELLRLLSIAPHWQRLFSPPDVACRPPFDGFLRRLYVSPSFSSPPLDVSTLGFFHFFAACMHFHVHRADFISGYFMMPIYGTDGIAPYFQASS
jgi:hypothetical protein